MKMDLSHRKTISLLVRLGVLSLAAVLAGCSAMLAHQEGNALLAKGQTQQGLAKLEQAVQLDPSNAQYRISLLSRRAMAVNRILTEAEAARRSGRSADAERAYRQVQEIEVDNVMARQGLEGIAMERRHKQTVLQAEATFGLGDLLQFNHILEALRSVLSEDPYHREALNLKAKVEEARLRALKPELKLAANYQKPISLEFRDAPLRSVFDSIAQASGLNFFFDSEIRSDLKITVLAKNTSIEDALHLLLTTNQLRQKILNGNSVLIYPNLPQKIKDYQPMMVRTFFLANAEAKAVATAIKTIVKTQDIVIDERLGTLILRDTPEAIRMAENIVALQDFNDPEVMLDVEVLEVKRSRLLELGVQWPAQLALAPLQGGDAKLTLRDLKGLSSITTSVTMGSMLINARKEDSDGNILANPRIRVRNKEKAKVMIGDRVPVITTTSTTLSVSESVNYVDVGLKLEVEPNIYLDDEVAIKVALEVSSVVREVVSRTGTLTYQIGTRGANTVLRLKNGETQILAGLISDEDRSSGNKVPGLGELPILGRLFGSKKEDTQRSEILLSITPRIVRALRRPDLMTAEFESGTESSIGGRPLTLSTFKEPQKATELMQGTPSEPAQPSSITVPTANESPKPKQGAQLSPTTIVPAGQTK